MGRGAEGLWVRGGVGGRALAEGVRPHLCGVGLNSSLASSWTGWTGWGPGQTLPL